MFEKVIDKVFEKTVEEIAGAFVKTAAQLRDRAETLKVRIQAKEEVILKHNKEQQENIKEALKAERLAKKIEEFLAF
jgi:hypothetical protein